jgi:hypothetical protein
LNKSGDIVADGMISIEQPVSVPPKLSWLKAIVRYGLHLIVLYQVVSFSTNSLPNLIGMPLPSHGTARLVSLPPRLLFSHLLAFSVIPTFVVGFVINAKFRHKAAEYIWIVPVVILVYAFIFYGPGMYPTMLWDSEFAKAFHYFFAGGLPTDVTDWHGDWSRAYMQLRFTAPAYGAIAYSIGAFLGMNSKTRALQASIGKISTLVED